MLNPLFDDLNIIVKLQRQWQQLQSGTNFQESTYQFLKVSQIKRNVDQNIQFSSVRPALMKYQLADPNAISLSRLDEVANQCNEAQLSYLKQIRINQMDKKTLDQLALYILFIQQKSQQEKKFKHFLKNSVAQAKANFYSQERRQLVKRYQQESKQQNKRHQQERIQRNKRHQQELNRYEQERIQRNKRHQQELKRLQQERIQKSKRHQWELKRLRQERISRNKRYQQERIQRNKRQQQEGIQRRKRHQQEIREQRQKARERIYLHSRELRIASQALIIQDKRRTQQLIESNLNKNKNQPSPHKQKKQSNSWWRNIFQCFWYSQQNTTRKGKKQLSPIVTKQLEVQDQQQQSLIQSTIGPSDAQKTIKQSLKID